MSLYKILEEIKSIRRFQLVQTAADKLELRLLSDNPAASFADAAHGLTEFFESKGLFGIEISRSNDPPQADKISGKFKHVLLQNH